LLVSLHCSAALHSRGEFFAWQQKYGKHYDDTQEEDYRFHVWLDNYKHVDEWNKESHSYTLKMNNFGDMTYEELIKLDPMEIPIPKPSNTPPKKQQLPASVDWRAVGAVTPVIEQGNCGSSAMFAAAVTMEGVHVISGQGPLVAVSVQQLLNCTQVAPYDNYGCSGGYMNTSIEWVVDNGGIDSEAEFPYYSGPNNEASESW